MRLLSLRSIAKGFSLDTVCKYQSGPGELGGCSSLSNGFGLRAPSTASLALKKFTLPSRTCLDSTEHVSMRISTDPREADCET